MRGRFDLLCRYRKVRATKSRKIPEVVFKDSDMTMALTSAMAKMACLGVSWHGLAEVRRPICLWPIR